MAEVALVDTSLRDGNQSLWGALGIDTAKTLTIAPVMDRVGFKAIDFTTSTHMGVAVRYKQEDPWERIRLMAAATPNTPLQFMSTGLSLHLLGNGEPGVHGARVRGAGAQRHPALLPRGSDERCALQHRLRPHGQARRRRVRDRGAGVHREPRSTTTRTTRSARAQLAACPEVDAIYIKDPGGLLSPRRARHADPGDQGRDRRQAARAALALHDRARRSWCTWTRWTTG